MEYYCIFEIKTFFVRLLQGLKAIYVHVDIHRLTHWLEHLVAILKVLILTSHT